MVTHVLSDLVLCVLLLVHHCWQAKCLCEIDWLQHKIHTIDDPMTVITPGPIKPELRTNAILSVAGLSYRNTGHCSTSHLGLTPRK